MRNQFVLIALASASLIGTTAMAQGPRRLSFQSKVDQFELLLSGNTGTVAGKPADLSAFKDVVAMVTDPLTADCPSLKGAPDVTVKENGQTRSIYLRQGVISNGEKCLNVGGDGLLFFPIHRDFLIGKSEDSIPVKSPIKVFRQGTKLFELHSTSDGWVSEDTSMLLDWDFLERWMNSLKSYRIRFRVLPELAKDKPEMIVQTGGESYEFYKITNVTWALKRAGHRWLEASDDWSFWYAFDNGVLEDRFTAQIKALEEPGKDKAERLAMMEKLDSNYTRSLHDLYAHMMLTQDEDPAIQRLAMQRLRQKPTKRTALAMAKYLQVGHDEDFKKMASQILKTHDPKGPIYKPSAPAIERSNAIAYWSKWLDKNQTP